MPVCLSASMSLCLCYLRTQVCAYVVSGLALNVFTEFPSITCARHSMVPEPTTDDFLAVTKRLGIPSLHKCQVNKTCLLDDAADVMLMQHGHSNTEDKEMVNENSLFNIVAFERGTVPTVDVCLKAIGLQLAFD